MFIPSKAVLKSREGTLAEMPLPLLLHALFIEERTCQLELKVRQLEKRIFFEEGAPVACSSNLLHESLGKFLVVRGKLSEAQYQQTLNESVQAGVNHGELLVQKALVSPFELYKQLQANLAHKILDCFRWVDARYRIVLDAEESSRPIRMNTLQLIYTGASTLLPFEAVTAQLVVTGEQRFALVSNAAHALEDVRISARDARLVQVLRSRPTLAVVLEKSGFDAEQALRRIYALCVMGLVDFAEAVADAPVTPPLPVAPPRPVVGPGPQVQPPAVPAAGVPFADDDDRLKNELVAAFLEHRKKDPFDLLGVGEDPQPNVLRKAFLTLADRFAPVRFRSPDLREKAEALLAALARAYGALSEAEPLALHRKRRQIAAEAKKGAPKDGAAEHFKIKTELLDAATQFEEGKKRLEAGAYRAAVEYLEYAFDIEPAARHRAYLAMARFKLNPSEHGKLALHELAEACRTEASCEEAWAFAGEIQRALGQLAASEESYRRAFKLNPANRRYPEVIRELSRGKRQ